MSETPYSSLTEVEVEGFSSKYNFANGHAYHDLPAALEPLIKELPAIYEYSRSISIPHMEEEFKRASSAIFGSPVLAGHRHYSVSPTASNSIDIIGAWLNMRDHNVGLLEPVFDNLYLMLNRRNVKITGIQESDLLDLASLEQKIEANNLKSIFIVTPNNPTGFQLDAGEFKNLCEMCERVNVSLIVDKTFRLYSDKNFDDYKILKESGVDFVVIEDTGKTWPTQDTKVSLMAYSQSLAPDLRMLYEEIYLCHSNFTLAFLTKIIERTKDVGLDKIVRQEVTKRMKCVEDALVGTPLSIVKTDGACALPLAWMDCSQTGLNDFELVQKLREHQVALLPGRFFYWDSQEKHTNNVRLSLMKPDAVFYRGLEALNHALLKIGSANNVGAPVVPMNAARPGGSSLVPK